MKKIVLALVFLVMVSVCGNSRQAAAYSVTVEEDGIYAEVVPANITENVAALFKKQVQKAMKYYDKYKDADDYTYIKKVPDEYRDFIEVAKTIQKSDEIIIGHPFYIFPVPADEIWYSYYFVAEKNHEKLCVFSIDVGVDKGNVWFTYDEMMDGYLLKYEDSSEETLYYKANNVIYAETSEKTEKVREIPVAGISMGESMEEEGNDFCEKNYEEKKEIIFNYLKKIKNGKAVKKSEQNIKLDLEEEYSVSEYTPTEEYSASEHTSTEEQHGHRVYIVAVVIIFCILAAFLLIRKQGRR